MELARPDWVKAQGIGSFAGQPVTFKDKVLGVLAVFSRAELTERTVSDREAISTQGWQFVLGEEHRSSCASHGQHAAIHHGAF